MAVKRYRLSVPVYMDGWCTVEIDDADDDGNPLSPEALLDRAIENAEMPGLCHQCAGWKRPEGFEEGGDPEWEKATISEMEDGERDY